MAKAKIATIWCVQENGEEVKTPTESTVALRWHWADGKKTEVRVEDFPSGIRNIAMVHGLKQKLGDEYAGADSVDVARGIATHLASQLIGGRPWTTRGEGVAKETLLAQAIVRALGVDMEKVVAKLSEMTKEKRAALRKDPQIAAAYEEIQLERQREKAERAKAEAESVETPDVSELFA